MTPEADSDPLSNAVGLVIPFRAVDKLLLSSFLYILIPIIIPAHVAYEYAIALGRATARGEEPPDFGKDNITGTSSFILFKITLFVGFLGLYILLRFFDDFLPWRLLGYSSSWDILNVLYGGFVVYINGAYNAVYAGEGSIESERVRRLLLSTYYFWSNLVYLPMVATVVVVASFLLDGGWLFYPGLAFLLAYWIMASFSYRGLVYRNALDRGVFEVDKNQLGKEWGRRVDEPRREKSQSASNNSSRARSVCSQCGNEMVRDADFCSACGARVEAKKEGVVTEGVSGDTNNCSECGEKIKEGASFCHVCGAELDRLGGDELCNECGEVLKQGAAFCQNCGCEVKAQRDISSREPDIEYKGVEMCTDFDEIREEITVTVRDPGRATEIELVVGGKTVHTFSSPSAGDSTTVDKKESQNMGVKVRRSGYLGV